MGIMGCAVRRLGLLGQIARFNSEVPASGILAIL